MSRRVIESAGRLTWACGALALVAASHVSNAAVPSGYIVEYVYTGNPYTLTSYMGELPVLYEGAETFVAHIYLKDYLPTSVTTDVGPYGDLLVDAAFSPYGPEGIRFGWTSFFPSSMTTDASGGIVGWNLGPEWNGKGVQIVDFSSWTAGVGEDGYEMNIYGNDWRYWNTNSPGTWSTLLVTAVPEQGAALLFVEGLLALASLGIVRRRRHL
jgi:hypothetical protein